MRRWVVPEGGQAGSKDEEFGKPLTGVESKDLHGGRIRKGMAK